MSKTRVFAAAVAGALAFAASAAASHAATRYIETRASPTAVTDVLVHLPLRNRDQLERLVQAQSDPDSPMYRHFLTVAQFRNAFAPAAADVARATDALRKRGFAITKLETQLIHAQAPVRSVEAAFGVHLNAVVDSNGRHIETREALHLPPELTALSATVAGLGHRVERPRPTARRVNPANRQSPLGLYWFDDLKQAYNYPAYPYLTGAGVTIATVGVSDFSSSDASLYFEHELLGGPHALGPEPVPGRVVFPGAAPFNPNDGASDEANIDVQTSNGSAPGATVVGVAAPDTGGEPFLLAYSYIDEANTYDIVSTSYGECELYYTAPYNGGVNYTEILRTFHDLFLQGNSQGITFLFSSGDDSGLACYPPGYFGPPNGYVFQAIPGTSIWSDDPAVTSVGGTNLVTTYNPPSLQSQYVAENAYADPVVTLFDLDGTGNYINNAYWGSGGGSSTIFAQPSYQAAAVPGAKYRTDPDVSMQMGGCPGYPPPTKLDCGPNDSASAYYIGGQIGGFIGTSLSSPEFAGLLALREQQLVGHRLGNVNPYIYKLAAQNATKNAFHQGIPGFNGVVTVKPGTLGYNPIVGVGTPITVNFLGVPKAPAAGNPQTASNP